MWLVVARAPVSDAPYWPGRRLLAAADAALWPFLWVLLFSHAPKPIVLMGPMVVAVALLCALGRLQCALWINHRYQFTTWRWGKIGAALLLIGIVLKVLLTS